MKTRVTLLGLVATALIAGCSTSTAPKTAENRTALTQEAYATINKYTSKDPSLRSTLDNSAGYAVFPSIGEGAVVVGAGYGRGILFERGQPVGYADLTKGSVGLSHGGQEFSQIIVFETQDRLNQFKSGNFTFSGDVSAVAVKAGAGASTQFKNGVAVFSDSEAGLMAQASLAGQRFTYQGQ